MCFNIFILRSKWPGKKDAGNSLLTAIPPLPHIHIARSLTEHVNSFSRSTGAGPAIPTSAIAIPAPSLLRARKCMAVNRSGWQRDKRCRQPFSPLGGLNHVQFLESTQNQVIRRGARNDAKVNERMPGNWRREREDLRLPDARRRVRCTWIAIAALSHHRSDDIAVQYIDMSCVALHKTARRDRHVNIEGNLSHLLGFDAGCFTSTRGSPQPTSFGLRFLPCPPSCSKHLGKLYALRLSLPQQNAHLPHYPRHHCFHRQGRPNHAPRTLQHM